MLREETRRQRYLKKSELATKMPVYFVTINFDFDENLAFLIRTAGCFGVSKVFVIGSVPPPSKLRAKSGSLLDFVDLEPFSNPRDFIDYCRQNDINIVSAELCNESNNIYDYEFDFSKKTAIVLGHESIGVPADILAHSDIVYIPMPGPGYCLNTSQTGTAIIMEFNRQYHLNSSCLV